MRDVSIIGIGQTPVGEHWGLSIRDLAAEAILAALSDAGLHEIDAIYIGNAYGGAIASQSHLGALVADHAGLSGIEAFTIEAADASGAAAFRAGYLAVASGAVDTALVLGVEKLTDKVAGERNEGRSTALDADYEAVHGVTETALAAMLMRRYMHEYGVELTAFEGFSVNAHANGSANPLAMFRNQLRTGAFGKAPMVAEPVGLFDRAPDADGAAAVVLTATNHAPDMVPRPIRIAGSAVATDTFMLQDRADMLWFEAVASSTRKVFDQSGVTSEQIDLFELHDTYTIVTTLTLESASFIERGMGWKFAEQGGESIALNGKLPISTFGGLKSRGNPGGATGVYQIAEATLQLRGAAGVNQVTNPKTALVQNMGGLASTVITHILQV